LEKKIRKKISAKMSAYDARRPSAENPLHEAQGQSFRGSSEAGSQYGSE
jgi:hypothetical protein